VKKKSNRVFVSLRHDTLWLLQNEKTLKIRYMKKIKMGLIHLVFKLVIVVFLIVSFSSCNASGKVTLNGKDVIILKFRRIHIFSGTSLRSDTSNLKSVTNVAKYNNELIDDFRYVNLFK
jgi:hypothetical protein